ncbi:hypothetical protein R1flu_022852 [Riccia fluitans]|uniref:Uncharacterized protein n=1 Tax=Riccia fluitans TaxID=41844 RepID=A0ABD1XQE7_9MARC
MSVAREMLSVAVCGNLAERRVIAESKLEGPSLSQRVLDPDASTPIQRSVPIPPVLGGVDPTVLSRQLLELLEKVSAPSVLLQVLESQNLTNRLVEAGGTIAELQTLRTEGTKAKLTGKVPNKDWLHEAKQRWRAHPMSENLFRLTEALEEHEDQILVREKMFLKHTKYLTVTVGDEEAPPDISKAAVVLCRRNDVLYTSAERQEQLDRPFTSFPGWNCAVSSEGGTINVPEQFRGNSVLYLSTVDRPLGSLFDRYLPAHIPLGVLGADNAPGTWEPKRIPHHLRGTTLHQG